MDIKTDPEWARETLGGELQWSDRGTVDGMPVTISGGYVPSGIPEQPLSHEVFLQRYVLAMAAGEVLDVLAVVDRAERSWQGIRDICGWSEIADALEKKTTEVPQ